MQYRAQQKAAKEREAKLASQPVNNRSGANVLRKDIRDDAWDRDDDSDDEDLEGEDIEEGKDDEEELRRS